MTELDACKESIASLTAENDSLAESNESLKAEVEVLNEKLSLYTMGDLNQDGKTDIEDLVQLLTLCSDKDALAQLVAESAITQTEINERYGDVEYYMLNGTRVDNPSQSGIYLVKKNGETKMVVVKK